MRIASALTAALAVAALGGLVVATIIDSGYHRLRDLEEAASRDAVAVAKLEGIRDSARHVVAVTGLLLRSRTADGVSGAIRHLERLSLEIRELDQLQVPGDASERHARVEQMIDDIIVELRSRPDPGDGSAEALSTYDGLADELGALIARLEEDTITRADAARSVLLDEARLRQRTDPALLVGYSVLMVLVLIALLRFIAAPVRRLTITAEDAIELGHRFRPVDRGPRELKQLGGTIASLVADLEAKVVERTSELAEQAVALRSEVESRRRAEVGLRAAIAEAEAASEAKSRFLTVMSHELRTPMNAILGTLTLLRDTELDHAQRSYVETARDAGQALTVLLNDLLVMTDMAAGGTEPAETEFDLAETLDQILSVFHPECCEKGVVLAGLLAPDLPRFVRGDPRRVRQILTKLVDNAVRVTDHGHIHVGIGRGGDDGGALAFSVEYTGTGIPEEDHPRGSADDRQYDPAQERRAGGTGQGIAICKGLVDALGGTITLSSKPEAGSLYRFTVPLLPSERAPGPEELDLRRRLRQTDLVIAGSCPALAESLHAIFDGWVASVEIAADPVMLSRIVSEDGPDRTCIICGPPERPDWPAMVSASRACCGPQNRVAIVPCVPGGARLAADHGRFRTIHDRALKPLALMRLACGYDVVERDRSILETARHRGGNILLVEDSAANRLVASAMLEKAGYSVAIAENGRDALEAVSRCRPDLILMDLQMPVMDGYEALAAIRAMSGRAGRIPVIALSANVMARSDAERRQIDFDAYLEKPLSRMELLDTVAATLDRFTSTVEARGSVEPMATRVE